jgi:hypothetical protein
LCSTAIRMVMDTVYGDTTLAQVRIAGAFVVCPLTTSLLHFEINDHVIPNVLMIQHHPQECWMYHSHLHLLFYVSVPKGSTCGCIGGVSVLNHFGEYNPKLMSMLVLSSALALNQWNDLVSLLESPTHPPVECWFINNSHSKCKFSNLERVQLFQVWQLLPWSTTILPFMAEFPSTVERETIFLLFDLIRSSSGHIRIILVSHSNIE